MKTLRTRLLAISFAAPLAFALPSTLAQEAASKPSLELAPTSTPALEPEVTLIPEPVKKEEKKPEPVEKPEKAEKSKTAESSEELIARIHYREAYTRAQREPKVMAEWERAAKAKTDLQKREALKTYYTLLHARIVKVDPSVKKTSDLRRAASLRRLEQTRIDPTEPLDPQERADRFNAANE